MITSVQLVDGIIMFAENELVPALKGWQAWAATGALIVARQQAAPLMSALTQSKIVSALGLVDEDGMIDIDTAASALKEAARKHGAIKVDIPGFDVVYTITEKEVEKLRDCINKAGSAK